MLKHTIGHAVQVSNKGSNNDGNIGVIINTCLDTYGEDTTIVKLAEVDFSFVKDTELLPFSCLVDLTYHAYTNE